METNLNAKANASEFKHSFNDLFTKFRCSVFYECHEGIISQNNVFMHILDTKYFICVHIVLLHW